MAFLLPTLLTYPTYHAKISAISEGNVGFMRININNIGQILQRNNPSRPELRRGLSPPAKPMAELGHLDEKQEKISMVLPEFYNL
jgi:hypothetical protein